MSRKIARERVYYEESVFEGQLKSFISVGSHRCCIQQHQTHLLLIVLERCCAQNNQNTGNLLHHIWISVDKRWLASKSKPA